MRTPEELLQQLKQKYPRYNWTLESKGWTILAVNKKGNSVYSLENQDTDKEESIQNLLAGKVQYMSDGYLVPENEVYLWDDELYKTDPTLIEELEESLKKVELETDTEEIKIETKDKQTLKEEFISKETSYNIAFEVAQKAKRALHLPDHEVDMLEHDINNLRANEWVDVFSKLSDRSEVKKLFFTHCVELEDENE
jgi:hypothetical protein